MGLRCRAANTIVPLLDAGQLSDVKEPCFPEWKRRSDVAHLMRGGPMALTCSEVVREKDVPDLIPARMLNEFAYCPRLAYSTPSFTISMPHG